MAEKCLSSYTADALTSTNNIVAAAEIRKRSKTKPNLDSENKLFGVINGTDISLTPSFTNSSRNTLNSSVGGPVTVIESKELPKEISSSSLEHSTKVHRKVGNSSTAQEESKNEIQNKNIEIYLETPVLDQVDSRAVSEERPPSESVREFLEDDTSSSCSNLINLNDEESRSVKENIVTSFEKSASVSSNKNAETICDVNSAGTASTFYENDVQSMDAIERRDFEHEQTLTGGVIIKASTFNNGNKLNLELLNKLENHGRKKTLSENKCSNSERDLTATPTTSRCCSIRLTKSAAKLNLSATLDKAYGKQTTEAKDKSTKCGDKNNLAVTNNNRTQENLTTMQSQTQRVEKQFDIFINSNSNDSLSSDKSYNTSSNHSLQNFFNKSNNNELLYHRAEVSVVGNSKVCSTSNCRKNESAIYNTSYNDAVASTSSHSSKCQYSHFCCENSARAAQKDTPNGSNISCEASASSASNFEPKKKLPTSTLTSKDLCNYDVTGQHSTSSTSSRSSRTIENTYFEPLLQSSNISLRTEHTENDFDDETWADCEEGSDEEVCTCYNYSNDYPNTTYIEDELPSRDVDLSGYIQLVTISEDVFLHDNVQSDTPNLQRKRKLNDSRLVETDTSYGESTPGGRKRIALDCVLSHKNNLTSTSQTLGITSPSSCYERRTPRALIPTKDNPPPELSDWLLQFQRWSHAERLLAVDRLIEHCEPTQVRHMMKVIEPQFQRDFISLLPKELALQVLSYLEPKDLLRAAQTCRSWRFLCDDNLLWKEKCKQAQIVIEPNTDRPKRGRAGNMPPISSPWKAAFMRQHIIEMNWRSRPIRQPKVLKGHDDHVITCLQFCGNRIVSGSDDNTLKVWSAITGKCLRTLVGHTGGVWSSQMSGSIIISGSTDRTLKVWNVETGQCIHTLLGHTSTVRCMHLHGNKVVSGSRDATLRVWDIEQGTCLHVLVGHLAAVRCVQYDGKLIVSGAYDYMVKVWNPERQECLHTLQGHTNRVYSLQFDGIHVVSGSLDTSIRVWDVETGSCKHTLTGHQSLTSGMELRQNILVSGNADSTVKVWDITTGQCLQTLSGPNKHQSAVTCLQFNSRFVITSSDDGTVKLWDVKTGEFIRNLVALDSGGSGGVVWRIRANDTKLICAIGSRNGTEETKLMILDFDVEGACLKCS